MASIRLFSVRLFVILAACSSLAACAAPAAQDAVPTSDIPITATTMAPVEPAPPTDEPPAATTTPQPTAQPAETPVPRPDPIRDTMALAPSAWPAPAPGTISVDAGQRFGRISPWLYGTNFDPGMTVPVALLDTATEAMGIRFIRFPGGSYGDLNAIPPKQYDDFIKLARTLGAEPHIHVRFLDRTPADAAEVVRYINEEKGYGVKYWAIGNEPPYFYQGYTAEQYATEWRDFAEAMLAQDPTITLAGPDISQFAPEARAAVASDVAEAREWMRVFLEMNGDLIGLVTWHRYPFPLRNGLEGPSIEGLRPFAAEFDQTIPELRAMIRETTGRDIPIGLTEVNVDSSRGISGEATADSPFAAVWLAGVTARLVRHGVPAAAQYAFQTRDGRGGWGLLERTRVRPQFYVYRLYDRFGQEQVYAATDDPNVTVAAALRDDGALTIMAVNLGDEAVERPLALAGRPGGMAEVYRIDEMNMVDLPAVPDGREVMEPVELGDGATVTLPPRSATLFVIP